MSNLNERLQQQVPLIDTSELPIEEDTRNTTSIQNQNRTSQFVNHANINNLMQPNSFLHIHEASSMNNNVYNTQTASNSSQNINQQTQNQSNESSNQTVVNIQNGNNENSNHTMNEQFAEQAHPGAAPVNSLVSFLVNSLATSLPFFLLLIAKIFHQHLLGFFIVLGFMTTLYWSNRNLIHQVELRDKKQNKKLILLILFLLMNIIFFFAIFKEYRLFNCLIFLSPNVKKMDTWNLIWIVVCSDTIVKYITISFKAVITILPFKIMPLRKRGNLYSLIENLGLFYRSLIPIHPWLLFLFYAENNKENDTANQESPIFLSFLCIFYSIFKLHQLYILFKEFKLSLKEIKEDLSSFRLGSANTDNEESICPICHDKFANPIILKCRHIFCEDCICVWFNKENSCPICRTKITIKKPTYKDGSTTIFIQWY